MAGRLGQQYDIATSPEDRRTDHRRWKPHQERESRPQQTKPFQKDTQPFATTATMPLLWDCNIYCYTHITGLPLFD